MNNQTAADQDKKSVSKKNASFSCFQLFIKTTILCILIEIVLLLLTAIPVLFYLNKQVNVFLKSANLNRDQFIEIAQKAWQSAPTDKQKVNFLILGIDAMENRGKPTLLTDTLMIASLDVNSGKINMLSLPRDLWLSEYQTKINSLLYYGNERDQQNPTKFSEEVIENLTQVEIDHVLLISLDNLKELIDILDGVEIDVIDGFTDNEFPRSDVDVTKVTDPKLLYESVTFEKGLQTMSGETALKYIRSRHSADEQGNDLARNDRQQQVIKAIFKKMSNVKALAKNPTQAGMLYKYYTTNFEKYLSIDELITLGKSVMPVRENIVFAGHGFSIADETNKTAAISHPNPKLYANQWVYIISDEKLFKQEVQQKLEQ